MPTMSLDPFGDKGAIASSEEVSSPEPIQKRAGLTELYERTNWVWLNEG